MKGLHDFESQVKVFKEWHENTLSFIWNELTKNEMQSACHKSGVSWVLVRRWHNETVIPKLYTWNNFLDAALSEIKNRKEYESI